MYPYIYQSTSLTIGSYGVMLAIAYLVGRHLYIKQVSRLLGKEASIEGLIVSLLVFGIVGAKLMFIIKNPDSGSFFDIGSLFSGSGFSSQGALMGAVLATIAYSKISRLNLSVLLDAAALPAIVAYGIARIGCFLAGDDCYGVQTDLPWGMSFPYGIAPTSEIVHPVPIYEILYSTLIALILIKMSRIRTPDYFLFFTLLVGWGLFRFVIEFVSSNPPKLLGMSGSQFGALLMFVVGLMYHGNYIMTKKSRDNPA